MSLSLALAEEFESTEQACVTSRTGVHSQAEFIASSVVGVRRSRGSFAEVAVRFFGKANVVSGHIRLDERLDVVRINAAKDKVHLALHQLQLRIAGGVLWTRHTP